MRNISRPLKKSVDHNAYEEFQEAVDETDLKQSKKKMQARTGGFASIPSGEGSIHDRSFRRSQPDVKHQTKATWAQVKDKFRNSSASRANDSIISTDQALKSSRRQKREAAAELRGGSQRQITMLQRHGQIMMPQLVKLHNKQKQGSSKKYKSQYSSIGQSPTNAQKGQQGFSTAPQSYYGNAAHGFSSFNTLSDARAARMFQYQQ